MSSSEILEKISEVFKRLTQSCQYFRRDRRIMVHYVVFEFWNAFINVYGLRDDESQILMKTFPSFNRDKIEERKINWTWNLGDDTDRNNLGVAVGVLNELAAIGYRVISTTKHSRAEMVWTLEKEFDHEVSCKRL